jgi:UDP-N-acetylmuramate dehydrogenase
MEIHKNYQLKELNGLKVPALAKYYVEIHNEEDIQELIKHPEWSTLPYFILGGGMNTVFVKDYDGFVVNVMIKGYQWDEYEEGCKVKIGAGEDWPEFIESCVDKGYNGNENLAHIPGKLGAAPIGNIAAYGQSQEDTFVELQAIDLGTGEKKVFNKRDCNFVYRYSKFKKEFVGKYLVTSVTYELRKDEDYLAELGYWERYRTIKDTIDEIAKPPYTVRNVFDAVVKLRGIKLPHPEEFGSLGSIFMNPFVSKEDLVRIQGPFPNLQFYPVTQMDYPGLTEMDTEEMVKIPAGWIFEELGWRDKWMGNVGTYREHAMVIVSREGVTGKEVLALIKAMIKDFKKATGIDIEPEIRLVG